MNASNAFKRGQIWFVNDKMTSVGSIQSKSRPYLVVSNDQCNTYSPVIHMAPITSQSKSNLPTHVKYHDDIRNLDQIILCEQIMPKSVPDIIKVSEYRFTLDDATMRRVDAAIAAQFAIKRSEAISLDDFECLLDELVHQKMQEIRTAAQMLTKERIDQYLEGMLDLVDKASKLPVRETLSESIRSNQYSAVQTDPNPTKVVEVRPDPTPTRVVKTESSPTIQKKNNKRLSWSTELKQQYLKDLDELPPEEVSSKYGISIKTLLSYKYRFQNELGVKKTRPYKHRNGKVKTLRLGTTKAADAYSKADPEKQKMIMDYDNMPISEFVAKYNLPSKAAAVEMITGYRAELEC